MIPWVALGAVLAAVAFGAHLAHSAARRTRSLEEALSRFEPREGADVDPEWVLEANELVGEAEFLWRLVRVDARRAARLGVIVGLVGVLGTVGGRGSREEIASAVGATAVGGLGWAYIAFGLRRSEKRLGVAREQIRAATSNVSRKLRARVDRGGTGRYPRGLD